MKKILKNKKGVTLLVLIVTIVVLVIIAGVTITLILRENGIIAKSMEAKEMTESSYNEETQSLANFAEFLSVADTNNNTDNNTNNSLISDVYDATNNYSAGEYCIFNNTLYVSLQDENINQTPNSSPTYWSATTIGSELKQMNSIGETTYYNARTIGVGNSSNTTITSVTVPAGNYIIMGHINLTARYNAWVSLSGVTYSANSHSYTYDNRNKTANVTGYLKCDKDTQINLNGGQNSGGTINITGSLIAIKIK